MPTHKSCAKRMKTSDKERIRNRGYRTTLRVAIKDLREETDKDTAAKKLREVTALLDKAASNNLIHKKNADRNKSRLFNMVAKLG